MNKASKALGAVVSGTLVLVALPAGQMAMAASSNAEGVAAAQEPTRAAEAVALTPAPTRHIPLDNVEGVFAWNQDATDAPALFRALYQGSSYLCAGETPDAQANLGDQEITSIDVKGDVLNPFVADVASLNKKAPLKKVMGCTCKGNPSDGLASANAEVEGFMLKALINEAQPSPTVNAITFTCADGYEVTLPLNYVLQRYSVIISRVNGESALDTIGCSNQLWLGNTAARTFARDVVSISFSTQASEPVMPEALKDANQPNVGVRSGLAS